MSGSFNFPLGLIKFSLSLSTKIFSSIKPSCLFFTSCLLFYKKTTTTQITFFYYYIFWAFYAVVTYQTVEKWEEMRGEREMEKDTQQRSSARLEWRTQWSLRPYVYIYVVTSLPKNIVNQMGSIIYVEWCQN